MTLIPNPSLVFFCAVQHGAGAVLGLCLLAVATAEMTDIGRRLALTTDDGDVVV